MVVWKSELEDADVDVPGAELDVVIAKAEPDEDDVGEERELVLSMEV